MTVRRRAADGFLIRPVAASPRAGRSVLSSGGFTLIELAVVLAIISVAAAIAVPRYGASIARFRAESAARRVAADLGYVRSTAQSASASSTVAFNAAAASYTVTGAAHLDRRTPGYSVELDEEPYHVAIIMLNMGAAGSVTFDGYGRPDTGGRVVVANGAARWEVTVEAETGAVGVQRIP